MPNQHNLRDLENQFHRDMLNIYERALHECKYRANRFLQMIGEHGGVKTAKRLLHTPGLQYGFAELWQCGCLKLTMEALVLKSQYAELFTDEEKQIARTRLEECGYNL
jgi:hypothetical protein